MGYGASPMQTAQPETADLAAPPARSPDHTWPARQRRAVADVVQGARLWRLALTLGWFDIRLRYRGSILGPFWLTLAARIAELQVRAPTQGDTL